MPHQETNGKLQGLMGGLNALADIAESAVIGFSPNREAAAHRRVGRTERLEGQQQQQQDTIDKQIESSLERLRQWGELAQQGGASFLTENVLKSIRLEGATYAHLTGNPAFAQRELSLIAGQAQGITPEQRSILELQANIAEAGGDPVTGAQFKAMAGAVSPEPAGPFVAVNNAADLANRMLEAGVEPGKISAVLQAAQTSAGIDTQVAEGIGTVINSLPSSQAEHARAKTQTEVEGAQPRIDALIQAGVRPETAAIVVHGKATAQLTTGLTSAVQGQLQQEIIGLDVIRRDIERVIPELDEAVLGLQGVISGSNIASLITQLPVTKQIAEAIGGPVGLDPESVNRALIVRSDLMFVTAQMARFILRQTGRISNEQLTYVKNASNLMGVAATPEAATTILRRLDDIAAQRIESNRALLGGAQLPGAAPTGDRRGRLEELIEKGAENLTPAERAEAEQLIKQQ